MVTSESEISAPCSHNWHSECCAKASGNKHCKWVGHMVKTTLLYDLSASRLSSSDLPIRSITLMMWRGAKPIKLNYFYSHLWLTTIQGGLIFNRCRIGQDAVSEHISGYWTDSGSGTVIQVQAHNTSCILPDMFAKWQHKPVPLNIQCNTLYRRAYLSRAPSQWNTTGHWKICLFKIKQGAVSAACPKYLVS